MAVGSSRDDRLIVSFGEMLIDFVPTVSGVSLAEAPGFIKAPGGAPANVAIAVSRLGGRAAFLEKLGDDEFGRMIARSSEITMSPTKVLLSMLERAPR